VIVSAWHTTANGRPLRNANLVAFIYVLTQVAVLSALAKPVQHSLPCE